MQSWEAVEEAVRVRSSEADLVIAGIAGEQIEEGDAGEVLQRYRAANNVLFVHAVEEIRDRLRACKGATNVISGFHFVMCS